MAYIILCFTLVVFLFHTSTKQSKLDSREVCKFTRIALVIIFFITLIIGAFFVGISDHKKDVNRRDILVVENEIEINESNPNF